jgi:hypothetical protein
LLNHSVLFLQHPLHIDPKLTFPALNLRFIYLPTFIFLFYREWALPVPIKVKSLSFPFFVPIFSLHADALFLDIHSCLHPV